MLVFLFIFFSVTNWLVILRVCVMGYPNGWVGHMVKKDITSEFGVAGEDEAEGDVRFLRRLCVCDTYFKLKSVHKYTKMGKGRD